MQLIAAPRRTITASVLLLAAALAACGAEPEGDAAVSSPAETAAPAGPYRLDPFHASLVFRVDHLGFSTYTAAFRSFDATLAFDPAAPEAMRVEATIDVSSLDLPNPPEGFRDAMLGPLWFNAGEFPHMTFRSTAIDLTGPDAATVAGDLTLRGVTQPVTLQATYNGGYAGLARYDPQARIGFSVYGTLSRSAFGMDIGVPTPDFPMGVGDKVEIYVEAEFLGPPLKEE